ncbi:MAG: T9SS type B sorting domain-containing protein [Flavobacterium sp.]|nr:T9SS type B sorting domain-containing protein [Flavobacterium sp.]
MKLVNKAILLFAILLSTVGFSQYIQVDDSYSAQYLVENVLLSNSPCAQVSNFSVTGDPFSNGEQSYGYFVEPTGAFPFSSGIVLSTSRASRTEGPNNNLIDEGTVDWLGDSDLEQALGIGRTYNATILEFDFTPLTSFFSFDYIFASEEYQGNAPCRYSDGFAFLLREANSTQPYQNLAIIPNTNIPVAVTTVRPLIGGNNGCEAQNPQYFGGFNSANHPTNFNGQTVVMTAQANVTPGVTYHIKLVIADEENIRYDSAIFLGGGSFNVGTNIGPDRLFATNNPVCEGETVTLDATEAGNNTYQWYVDGALIAGATNAQYVVTNGGTYTVDVNLGSAGCIARGEATIEYSQLPVVNSPTTLVQCDEDGDGLAYFNLRIIDDLIRNNDPNLSEVTYFITLNDAENDVNDIPNPTNYYSGPRTLYARVLNQYGCVSVATIVLSTVNNPLAAPAPIRVCDVTGLQDGFTTFNLNQQITPALLPSLPAGIAVEYYLSAADAQTQTNPIDDDFVNTVAFQQTIYARLLNGPDCYGILPITLIISTFSPNDFGDEMVYICDSLPATLSVPGGYAGYDWSTGATNVSSVAVLAPGSYSVTVTSTDGCLATKNFTVIQSGIAIITNVRVDDFRDSGNTVTIEVGGFSDNYQYSIDGINFQSGATFTNLAPGDYFAFVNDANGCGNSLPVAFTVLDYPRFFTPNGDGYNDFWRIENLEASAVVDIFDRYGKLLYRFSGDDYGWNGIYNNAALPSTDYWFVISRSGGRTVRGHFSLKR